MFIQLHTFNNGWYCLYKAQFFTLLLISEVAVPTEEVEPPPSPPETESELILEPPPPVRAAESKPKDVPPNCLQDPFDDIPIDETIPDAKHWTTNQVYQYFSTQLKPDLAQVFKDQVRHRINSQ